MSFIATAAASAAIAFCAIIPGCAPSATTKPPCVGEQVIVVDGEAMTCDITPPQVLVVMDPLTPCADMGGHMDGDACVDVDY